MKKFLARAMDFLSGGLGTAVVDTVKEYYPPSMSEKEKADLDFQIKRATDQQSLKVLELAHEEQAEFNQRIKDLEGTAKDLKSIPLLGPIMLFLRGSQRPVWGYATLYMDYKVFSDEWTNLSAAQESALWVINLLVLGFLFGERAIKNLMPLIERLLERYFGWRTNKQD